MRDARLLPLLIKCRQESGWKVSGNENEEWKREISPMIKEKRITKVEEREVNE